MPCVENMVVYACAENRGVYACVENKGVYMHVLKIRMILLTD